LRPQAPKLAALAASAVASVILVAPAAAADDAAQAQPQPRPAEARNWALRLPQEDKVVYRGVVNFDNAGVGGGSMLYPAPNIGGFLAAVIAHGIITEGIKQEQQEKLQRAADTVLVPYRDVLRDYTHRDLMRRALEKSTVGGRKKLVEVAEAPGADWLIESASAFLMTQDQSALILDNAVSIYRPDAPSAPAYQNIVRVVARASDAEELVRYWTANDGERLKEESASLFAESLDIVIGQLAAAPGKDEPSYRTIRYLEGRAEKMERAQPLSERCSRLLIKTLRGWLMSVPSKPAVAAPSPAELCGGAPAGSK